MLLARRSPACALLAFVAVCTGSADCFQDGQRQPLTQFVPSRDFIQEANPQTASVLSGGSGVFGGSSFNGSCNGIVEAALVYFQDNRGQGNRLAAVGETIRRERGAGGTRFLQQIDNLAQWADPRIRVRTPGAAQTVLDELTRTGMPQSITLTRGGYHAVIAYDVVADGKQIRLRVGDPNAPGDDNRWLIYDKNKNTWQYQIQGQSPIPQTVGIPWDYNLNQRRAIPNPQLFRDLVHYAQDMNQNPGSIRTLLGIEPVPPPVNGGGQIPGAALPPQGPNTGTYAKQAGEDRNIFGNDVSRAQRINRIQQISPAKSGFGGVILGNEPVRSPRVTKAAITLEKNRVQIEVEVAGETGSFVFADVTRSELWSAYNFLRPNQDIRKLGAEAGDLGLVGIAKNNIGVNGSWDFGVHPAIANTTLALQAMRLDMVLTLGDPRLPILPADMYTYRWYDEPAVITAKDGKITVKASSPPTRTLMRVKLWGREKEIPFDTTPFVEEQFKNFDALQSIDHFARVVSILTWIDLAGKLPPLPTDLQPTKLNLPSKCFLADVGYHGADVVRDQLAALDPIDPTREGYHQKVHLARLEAGKTYIIDLESSKFKTYLRLEDPAGKTLMENDGAGGKYNAGLIYRPKTTETYRLIATSQKKDDVGPYFLKVWQGPLWNSWAGRIVFPKKAGVKFGYTDEKGNQRYYGRLDDVAYFVLRHQDDWIKVYHQADEGWLDPAETVRLEQAVAYFTTAIQQNAKDDRARASRAVAWQLRGEVELALKDLDEAVRLNSKNALWRYRRGNARFAAEDFANALKDYDEALRLDADNVRALKGKAWLLSTCKDERFRDGAKAVELARRAHELSKEFPAIYLETLAAAYAEAGQFDRAIETQQKALKDLPYEEAARRRLELYQAKTAFRTE